MTEGRARKHQHQHAASAPEFAACKGFQLDRPKPGEALSIINAVVDALPDPILVIDSKGSILTGNKVWRGIEKSLRAGSSVAPEDATTGSYFEIVARCFGGNQEEREALFSELSSVIDGSKPECEWRFSMLLGEKREWFHLRATRIPCNGEGAVLVHRCVTDLHKAEMDLRESHTLFQHAIERLREGVCLYDKEGRFVVVNSVYAEELGFSTAQLQGRSIFEVFKPEFAKTLQEQNLLVMTTEQTFHFEMMMETPRGIRHFNVSKSVYRNHRNDVAGVFGVVNDITNHRRVEKTLEKSERHFRALIENSADRVVLLAEDGTIRYASPSTKRMLGFELEEMVGTDCFLWVHPSEVPIMRRRFKELLDLPGGAMTGSYRALRKDGAWIWMEATASNLLNDPSVAAIVVNERDISERKQAEVELTGFANIIASSNDAIISADPDGLIISWNPAAERIFGYSEKEILAQSVELLIPMEWLGAFRQMRSEASRKKGSNDLESVLLHKNGRKINVSLTLSPIRDRDGLTTGFSMIVRDITDRRRLEKEILEISDREKQRIGQDLHDDLCQHLVGISLVSNLLFEELEQLGLKQAADARHVTELVRHAVDHARTLARGLSPLNLVDGGFLTNLELLTSSTEQLFRVPCVFDCRNPLFVKNGTAAIHLYRITQEALHNAVKHSCASKVVVSVELCDNTVIVEVRDDGVGLPENEARIHESESVGGLGMHTMRYRARIIGATLEFRSGPGIGTSVICRVPKKKLGR
jgi:two-component system CheB/CheR fusion protein